MLDLLKKIKKKVQLNPALNKLELNKLNKNQIKNIWNLQDLNKPLKKQPLTPQLPLNYKLQNSMTMKIKKTKHKKLQTVNSIDYLDSKKKEIKMKLKSLIKKKDYLISTKKI